VRKSNTPGRGSADGRSDHAGTCVSQEHGIVHRDLKPENIMLRADGYIKVLDFDLARRTFLESAAEIGSGNLSSTAGLPVDTLHYMSPEQCRGEPATPARDVFAAVLVLYEIFTGTRPFHADSPLTPRTPSFGSKQDH
jgi:serine/threonine-protein kinase